MGSSSGLWSRLLGSQGCAAPGTVRVETGRPQFSHPAGVEVWAEFQAHGDDLRKLRPWRSDEGRDKQGHLWSGPLHSADLGTCFQQ